MIDPMKTSTGSKTVTRRNALRMGGAVAAITIASSSKFTAVARQNISGKVTMWCFPLSSGGQEQDVTMWKDIVDSFKLQYPDVELDVQVLPWEGREDKLSTAVAAGAAPDVCYLNEDYIPTYGPNYLEPLNEALAEDLSDFVENIKGNLTIGDQLFAAPILGTVTSLVYNTKLLDKLGVATLPTTWEEVLEFGPAFKDAGAFVTGYNGAVDGAPNLSFYPLLWQAGGDVLNAEGTQSAINSPEGLEALNFVVTLFKAGFVSEDEAVIAPPEGTGLFFEGKVGVNLCGFNSLTTQYAKALGSESVQVGPPLKHKVQTSYGTSAGYGVFKTAADVDASKAWVKYITSPDIMRIILPTGGYLPPRKSLEDMYASDPYLAASTKYISIMHRAVNHPKALQIASLVPPAVQSAFLGKSSPEDALNGLEQEINRLLKQR